MMQLNDESLYGALIGEVKTALGTDIDTLTIKRVVVGIFFTGVELSNGVCGLCATPIKSIPAAVCCSSSLSALPMPGKMAGQAVTTILADLERQQPLRVTVAIAALNALVETIWQRNGEPLVKELTHGDAFDLLDLDQKPHVALVGAFPPYIRELKKRAIDFKVLELDPNVLKPDEMRYFAPADTAPEVIANSDVLITTATTLVNGTLSDLLSYIHKNMQVAVIGPTTPLLPNAFAKRGVTVIGGTRVRKPEELLNLLAEGASGYHFFEKSVERVSLLI